MDGPSSLPELVEQVLDLLREVLVLALHRVQVLGQLLVGRLDPGKRGHDINMAQQK